LKLVAVRQTKKVAFICIMWFDKGQVKLHHSRFLQKTLALIIEQSLKDIFVSVLAHTSPYCFWRVRHDCVRLLPTTV